MKKLLIANRGEIAIRVARTAAELGIETLAVFAQDDALSLHTRKADGAAALAGSGPAAYLDIAQMVSLATEHGCDAVHPGYGFLSENPAFAAACEGAGLTFVGPAPATLSLFGDKAMARALAESAGVPVLPGTKAATSLEEAQAFLSGLGEGGAVMLKALAGGGGRGMRPVTRAEDLAEAYERCRSEAQAAFGNGDVYVEEFFPQARHVEVQILGDGQAVVHLWDRECSLQRQRQKVLEIAPAVGVADAVRERLLAAAVKLGEAANYRGLGTVEFLVATEGERFAFIEGNARLQVEHTVTEEVLGLDLVRLQLEVAAGKTLSELGVEQGDVPKPRGVAIQARVNLETMTADGQVRPAGGTLSAYEPPSGPGVRVDGFGYAGYRTSARYDSLLAKLIVTAPDLKAAAAKAVRGLREFKITGSPTNSGFLQAVLRRPEVAEGRVHTRFIEEHAAELAGAGETALLHFEPASAQRLAGTRVDAVDPLAVLALGKEGRAQAAAPVAAPEPMAGDIAGPDGTTALRAPLQGTVISLSVAPGDSVRAGQPVMVMEAMKMEHVIAAEVSGIVREVTVRPQDTVFEGHPLAFVEEADVGDAGAGQAEEIDLDEIRPDLAEVLLRHSYVLDEARPDAVAKRRKTNQRTARENIAQLVDPGSFMEYGPLVVAARRKRNTIEELIHRTQADGLIAGLAQVNGALVGEENARCGVMAYDYTVLAGTQGAHNHEKMDRLAEIVDRWSLPLVFFTEGGGGRPGDTEGGGFIRGFEYLGRLSGKSPTIGVNSGRCFAGNAAVLGCSDVIIATRNSTIGMGGPAMVEGGGLGVFTPEEISPIEVQVKNGVVDVLVEDEPEAVETAKQYLSYFQGPVKDWTCADQRLLRRAIPENRLRVYDLRALIRTLADEGSFLELRPEFGLAMVTGFVRIEGRPMGLIANNPTHLGGAIDSDASDKASRFMQLCEAYDLPILSLSDTPGIMVGPEAEKTALVRHCSRMFVIGANLTVPIFSVVLRKSYGLGAFAMVGGSYQASMFVVSWPTGEYGGMGLEGSVKLGYRDQLAAIADPAERKARFDEMVAKAYASGKALSRAMGPDSIDDVIDPAETRRWVMAGLKSLPPRPVRTGKKLRWIDTW